MSEFSVFDTTLFYAHLVVHVLHNPSTVLCKCKSNTEQHQPCELFSVVQVA